MKLILIIFLPFLFVAPAKAYIPRAKTIIKKMTLNNGRREYKIVREVTLQSADKQEKAREVWTVANGDKMKLVVNSLDSNNPWQFSILYGRKKRTTLTKGKKIKSFQKSKDFFEPLFHDRYHKSLTKRLIQHRFVPQWIIDTPPPAFAKGKTLMTPEPYISLEPVEGSISYAIGANTNQTGSKAQTQIWVEQDSFLIKKGRLSSSAEFVNSQFQTFSGGLKLPGEQRISWNDKTANIKLLAVERTRTKKKDWSLNQKTSGNIPSDKLIKEFYSRFR